MRIDPDDRRRAQDLLRQRFGVSRETLDRLDHCVGLLGVWQRRINLVSADTLPVAWRRHVLDSAQLLPFLPDVGDLCDLGSGAGFPGLVLAIIDPAPRQIFLIEKNAKKCAFLRTVARDLDLDVTVENAAIETSLPPIAGRLSVVTSRALAPLADLLDLASPALSAGAVGLFHKGKNATAELTVARQSWTMSVVLHDSMTAPDARIVVVRDAARLSVA